MKKNRIALLRKEKHISQSQLAKEANLSRQAVSLYEIGKREPKLATWERIASVFDVSVGYLQGISDRRKDELTNSELEKALNNLEEADDDLLRRIRATLDKRYKDTYDANKKIILQAISPNKLSDYSNLKILFLLSVSNLVFDTDNDEFKKLYFFVGELVVFMNQLKSFAIEGNGAETKSYLLDSLTNMISEINSNF